jgi:hypothetical protein
VDRAVETFQSIESIFGLTQDTQSYNALLLAALKARQPAAVRQIEQRMAQAGLKPDRETYRVLCTGSLKDNDEAGALAVLERAKADKMVSGGLYATLIKHYLGLRGQTLRAARKPDASQIAKAKALRDEALTLGVIFSERVILDIGKAPAPGASEGGKAADDYETAHDDLPNAGAAQAGAGQSGSGQAGEAAAQSRTQ